MYPERYRLASVTRYVIELLERRRPAIAQWSQAAKSSLAADAREALAAAGKQFQEVADDPAHWAQVERAVTEVALPRYFRLAQAQSALEQRRFDLWRGGDLLSRLVYGGVGLLAAGFVWAVPELPKYLEPLPLLLFVFGPVLPDVQTALLRRRYRRQLITLVAEMGEEEAQMGLYRPLVPEDPPSALPEADVEVPRNKERA